MWKIIFKNKDGSTTKITNKSVPIDLRLAQKYFTQYHANSDGGTLYQYPLKDNLPINLYDYINKIRKESE